MVGRRSRGGVVVGAVVACAAVVAGPAAAGQDAYISSLNGPAAVGAYHVAGDGSLSAFAGSPFGSNPGGGGETVVVSADGRFVFATNQSNTVFAFRRAADGTLTEVTGSPYSRGSGGYGLVATPDGRFLYATNSSPDTISGFAVGSDGTLAALPDTPLTGASTPASMAVSPDGGRLYVSDDAGTVTGFSVGADGALTPIAGATLSGVGSVFSMSMAPDGRRLYVGDRTADAVRVVAVAADGSLSLEGAPVPAGSNPFGTTLTPDGRFLYTSNYGGPTLSGFAIGADGTPTALPGFPLNTGSSPAGLTTNVTGTRLYVNLNAGDTLVYAIGGDGTLTPIAGSPFATGIGGDLQPIALTPAQPPTASFAYADGRFDASGSTDPDGSIATYRWDFGDGTGLADGGPNPAHAYDRPGSYTVRLTLTDDTGCSTRFVSTGQTPYCNGSGVASATRTVNVPGPTGQVQRDTTAPVISRARLSRTMFAVNTRASASAVRKGTRLSLALSEPATVVLVTERRVGRRWRKERIFGKRLPGGRSTLSYSGRIKPRGRARSLKPGRYRIRMRPSDRAGNRGKVTKLGFTIKR